VIRYHRGPVPRRLDRHARFAALRTGLQLKEDVVHRLVDVWATGEASARWGLKRRACSIGSIRWSAEGEALAARGVGGGTRP
jgi:hypothetical protein